MIRKRARRVKKIAFMQRRLRQFGAVVFYSPHERCILVAENCRTSWSHVDASSRKRQEKRFQGSLTEAGVAISPLLAKVLGGSSRKTLGSLKFDGSLWKARYPPSKIQRKIPSTKWGKRRLQAAVMEKALFCLWSLSVVVSPGLE